MALVACESNNQFGDFIMFTLILSGTELEIIRMFATLQEARDFAAGHNYDEACITDGDKVYDVVKPTLH